MFYVIIYFKIPEFFFEFKDKLPKKEKCGIEILI